MSEIDDGFGDLFGDPSIDPAVLGLAGAALHRIQRRAQRPAERDGRMVKGVERTELAQHIAQALRSGDSPRARELIEADAALFGANALVAEVTEQSRQLELASLGTTHDV